MLEWELKRRALQSFFRNLREPRGHPQLIILARYNQDRASCPFNVYGEVIDAGAGRFQRA